MTTKPLRHLAFATALCLGSGIAAAQQAPVISTNGPLVALPAGGRVTLPAQDTIVFDSGILGSGFSCAAARGARGKLTRVAGDVEKVFNVPPRRFRVAGPNMGQVKLTNSTDGTVVCTYTLR